jgi:putative MATE family efflux protein
VVSDYNEQSFLYRRKLNNRFSLVADFLNDHDYYRQLVRLTLPIALQNFVTASLNFVAFILIGQLGEDSVAAVGLANQIWFLLNIFIFGIVSGTAIFIAQLWGKQDVSNIRKVLGLSLKLSLVVVAFFWSIAILVPRFALNIYTEDQSVIEIGSRYLLIYGWSYIFYAFSYVFSAASRSVGNVRMPMAVSTAALFFNVLIAYPMIFGIQAINLPARGVEGAAWAGLIARVLECITILFMVYRNQKSPIAAGFKDLFDIDLKFISPVIKPVLPVILNEILWSLGATMYNVIYGHIGTIAVAAINIIATIEQLAFVLLQGIATATSIQVGHQIGNGNSHKAFLYGGRALIIQLLFGFVLGTATFFAAGNIFSLYKVDAEVITIARQLLLIMTCGLWIKGLNNVIIIGMLRSGGDTRFSLVLDGLIIWIVGVPFTAAGAFLFNFPIYLVYALTYSEETVKMIIGVRRYISKKWINDMTQKVAAS